MKRIVFFITLISIPSGVANWSGPTIQEEKQMGIEAKIQYLYKKYPPEETAWAYKMHN